MAFDCSVLWRLDMENLAWNTGQLQQAANASRA